jgi:hypothetical protein
MRVYGGYLDAAILLLRPFFHLNPKFKQIRTETFDRVLLALMTHRHHLPVRLREFEARTIAAQLGGRRLPQLRQL